jgi:hypothetical protein
MVSLASVQRAAADGVRPGRRRGRLRHLGERWRGARRPDDDGRARRRPRHARPDAGPDPGRADGVHAPLLAPTSPSAVAVCRPVPPSYREFAAEPAPASAEESTTSSRMDVLTMKLRHSFSQNQCGPGLGCLDDPAPDQRWPAPRPGTSGSYQLTAARISPQCCSNSRCPSLGYSTSLELGNTAEK